MSAPSFFISTACFSNWTFGLPYGYHALHWTRHESDSSSRDDTSGRTCTIQHVRTRCGRRTSVAPRTTVTVTNVETRIDRAYFCIGLVTNIPLAFVWGFLLHNLPAGFYTVPEALGSSDTHRELGVWWGFLALGWYILDAVFNLPTYVTIIEGKHSSGTTHVVRFPVITRGTGDALRDALYLHPETDATFPTIHRLPWYTQTATRYGSALILFVHALILFAVLVAKCSSCGGCKDKGPPEDDCYYPGRPGPILSSVTLVFVLGLIGTHVYLLRTKHGIAHANRADSERTGLSKQDGSLFK